MPDKHWVNSYQRRDGTPVRGHARRSRGRSRPVRARQSYQPHYFPIPAPVVWIPKIDLAAHRAAGVIQVVRSGWGAGARSQFVDAIGDHAWSRLERKWRTPRCQELARAADELDRIWQRSSNISKDLDNVKSRDSVSALLRFVNPLELHARQAANLIRSAGIAICWAQGSLKDCACLKAMVDASNVGPEVIVGALNQSLAFLPTSRI
jgi:hypothetical protein